ncbi:MAG: HdeD family acid-resistance protein [Candidatus Scatosoma sp.]
MNDFKKFFEKLKWEKLVTALLAVILGIVFVVNPKGSADFVCKAAGVAMIIVSAACLVKYFATAMLFPANLLSAAVLLLSGIFFLAKTGVVLSVVCLFFGIFLVIDGMSKIHEGIDAKKSKTRGWWAFFLIATVSVVLGILVMFSDTAMVLLGISLILDGIADIFTTLWLGSGLRKAKKRIQNTQKDEKDFGEMDEVK